VESAGAAGGSIRVSGVRGTRHAAERTGDVGVAGWTGDHARGDARCRRTAEAHTRDETVEAWIDLHGEAVLRLAYASLLNRTQAEDVFQEVFIKAYRHADRLQDPAKVRPWLLQVTVNACRDLRRSWWWRRIRDGSGLEGLAEVGQAPIGDPAAEAVRADVSQAVARAVRTLPDGFRETVVLHYFEGLGAPEIARITGVRVGTVHSRLHRARQLLRQQLEAWGVEP